MSRILSLDDPEEDQIDVQPVNGPPLDLDPVAMRGIAGDIVNKLLPYTEASAPALLFNLLAGFGSQAGRRAYTCAGPSRHYANLFGILVGPSNSGRKGTSWNSIKSILEEIDPDWTKSRQATGLSSGEGLIHHVRDERSEKRPIKEKGRITGYQAEIVDEGVTDKRLFLIEEEFSTVLKRMNGRENTLSAIVRAAWDGSDLRNLVKNSPDKATEPHISIIGHITKAEASDLVKGVDCQNGFANRFLWIYTIRSKFLPDAGLIPVEEFSQEVAALKRALEIADYEREIPLDKEAAEIWRESYQELAEGKPGLIGAVTSRAAPQVRRLALAYALLEGRDEQSVQNLESAQALWRYSENSAAWLFGTPFNDPYADRIFEALRKSPDGLSRSEVNKEVFKNHAAGGKLDRAIEILEKADAAYRKKEKTGGADREIWILTGLAK